MEATVRSPGRQQIRSGRCARRGTDRRPSDCGSLGVRTSGYRFLGRRSTPSPSMGGWGMRSPGRRQSNRCGGFRIADSRFQSRRSGRTRCPLCSALTPTLWPSLTIITRTLDRIVAVADSREQIGDFKGSDPVATADFTFHPPARAAACSATSHQHGGDVRPPPVSRKRRRDDRLGRRPCFCPSGGAGL